MMLQLTSTIDQSLDLAWNRIIVSWTHPVLLGAIAACVTWIACRWWYGRKLRTLRQQLERGLPAVASSEITRGRQPSPSGSWQVEEAQSLDLLERELSKSESGWRHKQPFLDTFPLTHQVRESTTR